jgi:hypothetical protein
MLTLDALDKLIYDGMTEDSGEHFSDIAHHVRNAARAVYAKLTEQQDALQAVGSILRNELGDTSKIPDRTVAVDVPLDARLVRAILKATETE